MPHASYPDLWSSWPPVAVRCHWPLCVTVKGGHGELCRYRCGSEPHSFPPNVRRPLKLRIAIGSPSSRRGVEPQVREGGVRRSPLMATRRRQVSSTSVSYIRTLIHGQGDPCTRNWSADRALSSQGQASSKAMRRDSFAPIVTGCGIADSREQAVPQALCPS